MHEDSKSCPHCNEEIEAGVEKCRHCGNSLELPTSETTPLDLQADHKWTPMILCFTGIILIIAGGTLFDAFSTEPKYDIWWIAIVFSGIILLGVGYIHLDKCILRTVLKSIIWAAIFGVPYLFFVGLAYNVMCPGPVAFILGLVFLLPVIFTALMVRYILKRGEIK